MNRKLTFWTLLIISLLSSHFAIAEARRDAGGSDPLRKAQYIIRQLSQEKSRLEADNGKLNVDLKAQTDKVEKLEKKLAKLEEKLDKYKKNNMNLVDRVKSDNERMKSLIEKYNHTADTLRKSNQDNKLLVNAVQERNQWMEVCRTKNDQMFSLNTELVERYRNKGFSDFLAEKESVTGLATVELENEEQEYRFRLEDLQVSGFDTGLSQ